MAAAAKHLTPVTLELGGKSPVYVHSDVDVNVAAKRLAWAKTMNAGQICVAPDYLLLNNKIADKFLDAYKKALVQMYGENPRNAPEFGRIVTRNHTLRLKTLLDRQLSISTSKLEVGGECDPMDRYFAPTIVSGVSERDPLMEEELFGPILPVLTVEDENEAIRIINSRDHPLVLNVHSNNHQVIQNIRSSTASGTFMANGHIVHLLVEDMPFGGVGPSGIGAYHGHAGFLGLYNPLFLNED
ncbi:UNVERIFIED_CONTAM: Aldehyde dehydrogenase [Siphonaria sp. JEL0065]|nr:Aldehyde dehydrogenase [Siphonaria sp. JEL0065]